MSLAWMFWSYYKLWLWLNHTLMWHFLFLSPVIAHFLSLSFSSQGADTLSGTLSILVCKAAELEMYHQSSVLWAQRASKQVLQTGICLQVWDQRSCPCWNPHSSALWWLTLYCTSAPSELSSNSFYLSHSMFATSLTKFLQAVEVCW